MFWMMIRMISIDFDGISDDLPDVYINITSSSKITSSSSKITSSSKIIIKNRFFIFASETFLGHLGGVGRLYLDDFGGISSDSPEISEVTYLGPKSIFHFCSSNVCGTHGWCGVVSACEKYVFSCFVTERLNSLLNLEELLGSGPHTLSSI